MTGKMTLNSEGRYEVSHRCEHLDVSASYENLQRFLYRRSTQMLCLQYELLNVSANQMIGKTTYCTGGRHVDSHQYELLNVSANEMFSKTT